MVVCIAFEISPCLEDVFAWLLGLGNCTANRWQQPEQDEHEQEDCSAAEATVHVTGQRASVYSMRYSMIASAMPARSKLVALLALVLGARRFGFGVGRRFGFGVGGFGSRCALGCESMTLASTDVWTCACAREGARFWISFWMILDDRKSGGGPGYGF